MPIKVFGKEDRTPRGKPSSEYPSWYFTEEKEKIKDSISSKEQALKSGFIPPESRNQYEALLNVERERLEAIEESTPKLTGTERDAIEKSCKEMGDKIRDSKFSRSEMEKGLADPHEEARRMVSPVIEIKSQHEAEFAKMCGIEIKDGKVSRNQAERMWKIQRAMLGEDRDTNRLRRD